MLQTPWGYVATYFLIATVVYIAHCVRVVLSHVSSPMDATPYRVFVGGLWVLFFWPITVILILTDWVTSTLRKNAN